MAIQARTEFAAALNQLASEKGVDVEVVLEAIRQAALAAYRKDLSLRGEIIPEDFEELEAKIDPVTGEISIFRGDDNITPPGFARIAAQTAKQVIMQRLHEAEKTAVMDEYGQKVGTVISGIIQRQEGNTYFIDLGRAEGVMPPSEQTRDEYYHLNQRLKFYIKEIREGKRGPEVVVSRCDPSLVKGLFALEVPEIQTGSVVIKGIAREAGNRTKIAASSTTDGVDPVGSLVGQKGVRVQSVMNELGEERIDIIPFSEDPARYIASSLSPAKDVQVEVEEKDGEKIAKVKVPTTSLSLAIGKGGQNVRLAAKLTGWKIDIEGAGEGTGEGKEVYSQGQAATPANVLEESAEAEEVGEQPMSTDETAQTEGRAAVVESIEDKIDQATEEESVNGAIEPEPTLGTDEQSAAATVAEEDITAESQGLKEKIEEDSGSVEETEEASRGDIVATHKEVHAPEDIAETVDMPEEQKMVESMEKAPSEENAKEDGQKD